MRTNIPEFGEGPVTQQGFHGNSFYHNYFWVYSTDLKNDIKSKNLNFHTIMDGNEFCTNAKFVKTDNFDGLESSRWECLGHNNVVSLITNFN